MKLWLIFEKKKKKWPAWFLSNLIIRSQEIFFTLQSPCSSSPSLSLASSWCLHYEKGYYTYTETGASSCSSLICFLSFLFLHLVDAKCSAGHSSLSLTLGGRTKKRILGAHLLIRFPKSIHGDGGLISFCWGARTHAWRTSIIA